MAMTRSLRFLPAAVMAGALALTACSSSHSGGGAASGSSGADTGSSASAGTAAIPAYDGPEKPYLKPLAAPAEKGGYHFTVGYLQVYGGVNNLLTTQKAAVTELQKLGGSVKVLDAQLNPQTQVSQFDQFIAQKVDAIVVMPTADEALAAPLAQAKAAGIPVIAWGLPTDKGKGANPDVQVSLNTGFDYGDYQTMKVLATQRPGSTFALMGTGLPSDQLKYITARLQYWGQRMGLKYLGEQDAQTDNPSAYTPALQAIFSKYPNVDNVITYNDESALTASTVAAQLNNTHVHIADPNSGQQIIVPAIKSGKVATGYYVNWNQFGTQLAYATYDVLTKQGQPLPRVVVLPSSAIVQGNVDSFQYIP